MTYVVLGTDLGLALYCFLALLKLETGAHQLGELLYLERKRIQNVSLLGSVF